MTISLKQLSKALGEYDYAMKAASYGAQGHRSVIVNAVTNLPTPELEKLRPVIDAAIKDAVARTQAALMIGFVQHLILQRRNPAKDMKGYNYGRDC